MKHDAISYETVQLARDVYEYALRIYTMRCNSLDSSFLESMLQESLSRLFDQSKEKQDMENRIIELEEIISGKAESYGK